MTLLNINLTDVLSETDPDDKVVVWAPVLREGPDGQLVGPRRKSIPLTDGVGSDEVVPGPLMVQVQCKTLPDTRPREVVVPEEGPVTLTDLLDSVGAFTYAPPVVGQVAQLRDEAVQAAVDADLAADRADLAADRAEAGGAVGGDAQTVLDARDQAVAAATNAGTSETAASGSASASASSASAAATSEINAGAAATAAAGSASDAASSATSAATSESAASESATNAASSETAAAGHSTDAQAAATAAAGSAASASTGAGRAETAATSAEADATQTWLDRTATGEDRVQTGLDRQATETARDQAQAAVVRTPRILIHTGTADPVLADFPDAQVGDLIERVSDGQRWKVEAS